MFMCSVQVEKINLFLFPVLTRVENGNEHWYLIAIKKGKKRIHAIVWDTLWSSQTKREKKWDEVVVRYGLMD